jgi:hypothetical protein
MSGALRLSAGIAAHPDVVARRAARGDTDRAVDVAVADLAALAPLLAAADEALARRAAANDPPGREDRAAHADLLVQAHYARLRIEACRRAAAAAEAGLLEAEVIAAEAVADEARRDMETLAATARAALEDGLRRLAEAQQAGVASLLGRQGAVDPIAVGGALASERPRGPRR